ncbi:MAG: capsule biosynthesis protein CapK [Deltaproteobacteria bacterium]|nr:MAG: capsule biosynthesis protein CapK [Deltaproteobacteria bacterium]
MTLQRIRNYIWRFRLAIQGNSLQYTDKLKKWQWLDPEATNLLQKKHLESLLRYTYQFVPYYREVLSSSKVVDNYGNVNVNNFTDIPLLDKNIIRSRTKELITTDLSVGKCYENTSGGSTGEPVRFLQNNKYYSWNSAITLLQDEWMGHSTGKRLVQLWGSERDLFVGKESLKIRMSRCLRNVVCLNAFHITPLMMQKHVDEINRFKPTHILAYVESLYDLARYVDRQGQGIHSPESIMVTAGTLDPHMRATIEKVFNSSVFNRYGSREVGAIACECNEHQGLHVTAPTHYIEILRPNRTSAQPGEVGEIVVTLLTNFSMPLIRYRIGDMGAWAKRKCSCGRGWPLLQEVKGRVTDVFYKRDGAAVHGEYFTHLFYNQDWVEKFQVIQEDFDLIRVLIVLYNQSSRAFKNIKDLEIITQKIRIVMGQQCQVHHYFVDHIDATPSGKFRYNISKLHNESVSPSTI